MIFKVINLISVFSLKEKKLNGLFLGILFLTVFSISGFFVPLAKAQEATSSTTTVTTTTPAKASNVNAVSFNYEQLASKFNSGQFMGFESIVGYPLLGGFKLSVMLFSTAGKLMDATNSMDFYESLIGGNGKKAIDSGWKIVRDFFNLFFIIILIVIAISVSLGAGKFSDKKLVSNVLGAALLINFSKPIAYVFLDVSNLLMSFFMAQSKSALGLKLANNAGAGDAFPQRPAGDFGIWVAQIATTTIIFLILACVFFFLAITFVIRLVAFFVLIILSPMAFFAMSVPGTSLERMKSSWLSKIVMWSFYGPVMMFFIWLTLSITQALNNAVQLDQNSDTLLKILTNIIPFIATIYLLFYGYDISMKMAQEAGGLAGSVLSKGKKWMQEKGWKYGAAIATAGVAPLLATGGAAVGRRAGALMGGFRDKDRKWNNPLYLIASKEKWKERNEKIKKEWTARGQGPAALDKYERGEVNSMVKKWDDLGTSEADVAGLLDKGNSIERKAAASWLASKGKINTVERYRKAKLAAGRDTILMDKIRKDVEKENVDTVLKTETQEIADFAKFMTSHQTTADIQDLKNTDSFKDAVKNYAKKYGVYSVANQDELIRNGKIFDFIAENNKALERQLRKTGHTVNATGVQNLLSSAFGSSGPGNIRRAVYNQKLNTMSHNEIFNQDKNFFDDTNEEVHSYMANNTGAGKRFSRRQNIKAYNKMKNQESQSGIMAAQVRHRYL